MLWKLLENEKNEKQNNQDYLKILLEDMSNKNIKANDIL